MKKCYKVWCEYDIGQDSFVFASVRGADAWVRSQTEIFEELGVTPDRLIKNGLIAYEEFVFIKDKLVLNKKNSAAQHNRRLK